MDDRYRTMLATLLLLRSSLPRLDAVVPALRTWAPGTPPTGCARSTYGPAGQALLESFAAIGGARWLPPTLKPGRRPGRGAGVMLSGIPVAAG